MPVTSLHRKRDAHGTIDDVAVRLAASPGPVTSAPSSLTRPLHGLGPVRHALGLFCVWPRPPVLLLLLLASPAVRLGCRGERRGKKLLVNDGRLFAVTVSIPSC